MVYKPHHKRPEKYGHCFICGLKLKAFTHSRFMPCEDCVEGGKLDDHK